MSNLTEQWKKGKLEWHKSYYCQNRKGEVTKAICLGDSELHSEELGGTLNIGYWEVLAPVPSYEEWQAKCEDKNAKVWSELYLKKAKENQQLKELLKECREEIDKAKNILTEDTNIDNTVVAHATLRKILTKIDNAIGEKK